MAGQEGEDALAEFCFWWRRRRGFFTGHKGVNRAQGGILQDNGVGKGGGRGGIFAWLGGGGGRAGFAGGLSEVRGRG